MSNFKSLGYLILFLKTLAHLHSDKPGIMLKQVSNVDECSSLKKQKENKGSLLMTRC